VVSPDDVGSDVIACREVAESTIDSLGVTVVSVAAVDVEPAEVASAVVIFVSPNVGVVNSTT